MRDAESAVDKMPVGAIASLTPQGGQKCPAELPDTPRKKHGDDELDDEALLQCTTVPTFSLEGTQLPKDAKRPVNHTDSEYDKQLLQRCHRSSVG